MSKVTAPIRYTVAADGSVAAAAEQPKGLFGYVSNMSHILLGGNQTNLVTTASARNTAVGLAVIAGVAISSITRSRAESGKGALFGYGPISVL